jgi:hypothetical protein
VLAAMTSTGRVLKRWETTKTAVGTTHYGRQCAELFVSVLPSRDGSVVQIRAAGDDIWGVGGRKGAANLIRALDPRWASWSVKRADDA